MTGVYLAARQAGLTGGNNLVAGTVTAHLCTAAYTPDYVAHTSTTSLGASVVKTTTLTGKSLSGESFTSTPAVFTAVTGAQPATQVILSVGTALIACIDDFGAGPGATTMPLNGSDIQLQPSAQGWIRVRNP